MKFTEINSVSTANPNATTYTPYAKDTLILPEYTLQSIKEVYDEIDLDNQQHIQRLGVDTTVLKAITGWTIADIKTNTHIFRKDLSSIFGDMALKSSNVVPVNATVKIGNTLFTTTHFNNIAPSDTENLFSVISLSLPYYFDFRVNKTTYPTTASFETYLQANDVTFIYELAESVFTNLTADNSYTAYNYGLEHIVLDSPIIPTTNIEYPTNIPKQVNTNTEIIASHEKRIIANETDITTLQGLVSDKIIIMSATEWAVPYVQVTGEVYGVYDESTFVITWYYGQAA
jgi:hypothetical protein